MAQVGSEDLVDAGGGRGGFGLAGKVIVLMLAVSLLPLALFGFMTLGTTSASLRASSEAVMSQAAEGLMSQVDEWLDKNVRVLQAAANLADAGSMQAARQEDILKAVQQAYPWMYLVFTVDLKGGNVARSDGKPLTDYSDRDYYRGVVLDKKDLAWQTLIGKTSKKPALVLAVPIRRGGELVGVMAAAMAIDDISARIDHWRRGQTGFAFLVDEKGKIVAHQIQDYVLTQMDFGSHPLITRYREVKQAFTAEFAETDGRPVVGHVTGNRHGWSLVVQQEAAEVFADLNRTRRFGLMLLGGSALLVVVVAWLAAAAVVRPIRALTRAADRMSMGDLDVRIQADTGGEIGQLAQSLDRMRASLAIAMARLSQRR